MIYDVLVRVKRLTDLEGKKEKRKKKKKEMKSNVICDI